MLYTCYTFNFFMKMIFSTKSQIKPNVVNKPKPQPYANMPRIPYSITHFQINGMIGRLQTTSNCTSCGK